MKDETSAWLRYAEENLAVARLSLEKGFLHACLQNAQQCIEKALKAVVIENGLEFRKTHSVQQLAGKLATAGVDIGINEDECDLIDAVYLPSKYPVAGILPDGEPDSHLCRNCLDIAERASRRAREVLERDAI